MNQEQEEPNLSKMTLFRGLLVPYKHFPVYKKYRYVSFRPPSCTANLQPKSLNF